MFSEPMDDSSDHDLMLQVRAGELSRLGDLFERHHRPLFGFLTRLTCSVDTAEDIVQIVFQRILKYRHPYRYEGKFTAWLAAPPRTTTVAAPALPPPTHPADFTSLADHDIPAAEEQTARRDDLDLMQSALSLLPLEQREILVLHRFQHLKHDEIARLLNITVGATKVRVHRALTALRDQFFKLRYRAAESFPPMNCQRIQDSFLDYSSGHVPTHRVRRRPRTPQNLPYLPT
ncbi:MAG: RNA polymerase sigma factor [Candidatus Synoicihabitans palmerolidicus]|nr:RNA polymerase sigma factor [Candidatus Synoicihabitans palmerolidicus]